MEFLNQLYLVTFFQSVFFIILLLIKRNKSIKDYLLAFFIFLLALESGIIYAKKSIDWDAGILFSQINIFIWTLLGPVIYLYIESVIHPEFKLKYKSLIHLIPLVFTFITISPFLNDNILNLTFEELLGTRNGILVLAGRLVWGQTTNVYYLIAVVILLRHRKRIKYFFSEYKESGAGWLIYITIGFAAYLYLGVVDLLLWEFVGTMMPMSVTMAYGLIFFIYVFGIGFFGYRQNNIFANTNITVKDIRTISVGMLEGNTKYKKSGLREFESEELKSKLISLMEKEKPYLNFEISISDISEKLNTTVHKLSQVLNESFNQNFYDFINSYRVEEFKKRLHSPDSENYKMLSLAFECGFNSKTTFYGAFKKFTGLTPSDYKDSALNPDGPNQNSFKSDQSGVI